MCQLYMTENVIFMVQCDNVNMNMENRSNFLNFFLVSLIEPLESIQACTYICQDWDMFYLYSDYVKLITLTDNKT